MTLTIERLKWLHDAATELSATKLKMTMRPDELLVLTRELLANREAQPVALNGWHVTVNRTGDRQGIASIGAPGVFCMEVPVEYSMLDFMEALTAPPAPQSTSAADWGINMQTGTPILVYKNCSVIESEQAHYVLSLINSAETPAPAVPDDYQHLKNVQELYHKQEERLFALAQRIKGASFDKYSHTTAQAIDVLEREIFGDDGDACRAAMLAAAPEES